MVAARSGCERILWIDPTAGEARRRELRWTCRCRSVVFFLIAAGGVYYIERVENRLRRQTHRMPAKAAEELWQGLLLGQVC